MLCVNSCCDTKVKTVVDYKLITPPESLLEPCVNVPIEVKTNGDLVMTLLELHTQYLICSAKIDSLRSFYDRNVNNIEE